MQFQSPEWFLLIPVFAAVGWYWKGLKLWSPFRALSLALIVLVLADPQVQQLKKGLDLWVLVDRSESAEAIVDRSFDEWKRLLERSKPSRYDDLHFVNFAGEVVEQAGGETQNFAGNTGYTRTRLALESTIAMLRPDRRSRLLVFSDGYSTEPLGDVGHKLSELEVPLDYRLLRPPEENDYQILALNLPTRARLGEPFVVELIVRGDEDGPVPVLISRDNGEPLEQEVEIVGGIGRLQFSTRLGAPGAHKYRAELPVQDAYHGNNQFENWIEITSGPRVLLVSGYSNDPVAEILRTQGFEVEIENDPTSLQVGQLTGCKVLILNNVPAYEIPMEFLSAVDFFVRQQGGGLLMAGGKQSFAAGGYFESPIDELLPVSMELKTEHRKLAVAMSIIMDRSGSMSMTVPGGRSKMDLANEGSARAVELLGNFDQITVDAVDSTAHKQVPLMSVGPNRAQIINRIRRIESMGGGIYVYTGLKAGWDSLKKAEVGTRHVILFSDAADSEEPGKYKELIKEITDNGGTITVIGLGTKSDPDAAFLEDIAKRGNGRIFFTENPAYIPNIFAQETVTVARSLFIEDPVALQSTGQWLEISGSQFDWLNQVDAYNLSYLRENASAAVISSDEYAAPMVAFVQRGIGRTSAVSFPLGGEFSQSVRNWERMGDFVQTLTRWLMGETLPPGIGLRTELNGTDFSIDLLHDESWVERLATPPRIFLAEQGSFDRVEEITWKRLAPGHFRATTQLEHGKMVRGAIQVGNVGIPFGPIVVGSSPEWAFDRTRVEELRQTAEVSGGEELVELSEAWKRPEIKEYATIQPWLLIILFIAILADALFTRMGWQMPVFEGFAKRARQRATVARPKKRPEPQPAPESQESAQPVAEAKPSPEAEKQKAEEVSQARRSRFARAKKRR